MATPRDAKMSACLRSCTCQPAADNNSSMVLRASCSGVSDITIKKQELHFTGLHSRMEIGSGIAWRVRGLSRAYPESRYSAISVAVARWDQRSRDRLLARLRRHGQSARPLFPRLSEMQQQRLPRRLSRIGSRAAHKCCGLAEAHECRAVTASRRQRSARRSSGESPAKEYANGLPDSIFARIA